MAASESAMLGEYCDRLGMLDPNEVIVELKRDVIGQDALRQET